MDGSFIDLIIMKMQWLLDHPEVTWSGSGIYALSLIGSAVLAVASCVFRRKKRSVPVPEDDSRRQPPAQKITNQFNNNGGDQNIAQGSNAIGKQINISGIPPETLIAYAEEFGVTKSALTSFFKILEQEQVPSWELDSKLREIASHHKELLLRFESVQSDDPEVRSLKAQAKNAIEDGKYDQAEMLLAQARECDRQAVTKLKESIAEQQAALTKRQLSEAASCAEQAKLQEMLYCYEKAAEFWQDAAMALPEGKEWYRAACLNAAGYDFYCISNYTESISLWNQCLVIYRKVGNRKEEANMLNSISGIYQAQGELQKALKKSKQSLLIAWKVSDKGLIGTILNNTATIYLAKKDYSIALNLLKQSLQISRENKGKDGGGSILNNIGQIYSKQGEYLTSLKYLKRSLHVRQQNDDKRGEGLVLINISKVYSAKGYYKRALRYLELALEIQRQIGDRKHESVAFNDIGIIYWEQKDTETALKYLKRSLAIRKEIGVTAEEAGGSWNIGWLYTQKGQLSQAEPYLSRAVELAEQLEHSNIEDWRETLEDVRSKLQE